MRATGRPRGGVSLKNMDRAALKRLVGYIMRRKGMLVAVLICIALSSIANVASSLFLQSLIDDYIAPLLLDAAPVFTGLLKAIVTMGCIYVVGVLSSLCYNRLMATVAQSTLKDIRDDMFAHMQTLPLRYFDTHTHGDVMSYYTNDTDTLRQMISQSLPQVVSAAVTLITVLVSMLSLSFYLTAFAILYVCLMLVVSRKIAARSGKYFVRQQKSIGDLNGYVEEMINGQRVVKVFCHEEAAEKDFDRRNEELCHNTSRANGYGNMLMPVMVSLSSLLYVLMAIIGGSLAIAGVPNFSLGGAGAFTLGTIASFMQLSRSFTQPINQVSQQLNSVVMALAGAGRIFQLMDEPSESDEGYVTLQKNANGDGWEWLRRCDRRYGIIVNDAFAGKRPLGPMGTPEGARVVHEHLGKGGLYLANVISPVEGRGAAPLMEAVETYVAEFGHVYVFPERPEHPRRPGNNAFVASERPLELPGALRWGEGS